MTPLKPLASGIALATTAPLASAVHADDQTLDFGVPAWPGITVKSAIAEQLLNPLGYATSTQEIGLQVVYQGIESGDIDVFWAPGCPPSVICSLLAKSRVY